MGRLTTIAFAILAIAQGRCFDATPEAVAPPTPPPDSVTTGRWVEPEWPADSLYCSARLDCSYPDAEGVEQPILLLRDSSGERARTLVIGFACTGRADRGPSMYLDPVVIDCGDAGTTVLATDGPSGVSRGAAPPLAFDHVVYRGAETAAFVGSTNEAYAIKRFWNFAIGIPAGAFPSDAVCTLHLRGAAAPRALAGDLLVPDGTWSAIRWNVALNTPPGDALTCGQNPLGGDGGAVVLDDSPQAPFAASYP